MNSCLIFSQPEYLTACLVSLFFPSLGTPVRALLCMPYLVVRVRPAQVVAAVPQPAQDVVEVVHHVGNLGPNWSSCEDLPG